ncbi:hypothetical protein Bca4012_005837 [Brassica carinata]
MNCVLFGEPRLARTASQCSHHCFWFCCLPRNIFQGELSFFTCLEKYGKNFKKSLLTDHMLPLLTDSALRDVSIPPGPRLLILIYHIQRFETNLSALALMMKD